MLNKEALFTLICGENKHFVVRLHFLVERFCKDNVDLTAVSSLHPVELTLRIRVLVINRKATEKSVLAQLKCFKLEYVVLE